MATTRREFMRHVGVLLATGLVSGCQSFRQILTGGDDWTTLRACWLALNDPQLRSYQDTDFSRGLRERHRQALDGLVADRRLDRAVAEDIQMAFKEAIAHIQRQQATCYTGPSPIAAPRQDMMVQTAALTEMAEQSAIDPATVERARAALARDMAWLAQFRAGQAPDDLETIEATPTEIEAARILADLLLE